jgi:cyclomaltodextrinase / maltogenic alpha-amylase / neopullulanase
MIESATYWLDRGLDGFRCDYANGPSHAFWSAFRAATRAAKPDSITLGEVVETPELQRTYQGRLDGCLDFLLLQGLRQFFAFDVMTASAFDGFLQRHLAFFAGDFVLPSFLDNHDMNRFLWVVRGDVRRLKLAALCQFTLPHPPIIYYGTNV